jgi:ParB-like nuclease domain.
MIERAELAVDALTVDPLQSRNHSWSGDELDQQLAASIDEDGLFHDVLVRPLDAVDVGVTTNEDTPDSAESGHGTTTAEYAIIAGSRRYHAAMESGRETLPCKIITADDLEAAWASLNENTDRRELSEQEIAQQLDLIYQLIRPKGHTETGEATIASTAGELDGEQDRFETDEEALEYLAERYCGRSDDSAIKHIREHLDTAALPPVLQSLFKDPEERTATERTALDNHGIDTRATLGSGEGKSGTSRAVVALHNTLGSEFETDAIDPVDAVLETVGSLQFDSMSELELRQSLREFREDVSAALDGESATEQRDVFRETLQRHTEELQELHEEIEPNRPFKRVDLQGPDTQRHSRWHAQAMRSRGVDSHTELVRELYQERLENLAAERGWE